MQCVRTEQLFQGYYPGSFTFPAAVANGTLPPWWYDRRQELLRTSPAKHSPKLSKVNQDRRGSGDGKVNVELENSISATNSSWNFRNPDSHSPRNPRKIDNAPVCSETDETEKENWLKSGQEKGVYRPRMRRKPKKKDNAPLVWSLPP